ncbi:paralemmin-3 isoform X5 [Ovis canadensis]|uniref:paralemmin-3 isoform X5 n=1 Tax=Ovis canadensis TaxID=37174 RepID=UPI003752A917
MALQSHVWSLATPTPMAESSLYRQRLEVIAEKRRLQEEIRAARRELEEEKLRVERLKRKSLRERWLMDGAAEEPERPQDPTSQDPQSPEDQAQARIRNLEDSLFTLQSQLQLLQSASTGAQHKPSGRPTWRRQGHRPLSQPNVESGPAGQTDLNKRASLPAGPVGAYPESPSEPRTEAAGVPAAPRRVPGAAGTSSEANGPCPGSSPPLEQEPSQGVVAPEGTVNEARGGGMVKVVWEGLRPTEDCANGATGLELEAKVEEMVLEAIGDRQEASRPELPSWVKEDRAIVEVVWEGVGGTEGSDLEAMVEAGRAPEAVQTRSLGLREGSGGAAPGEGAPRSSPDGDGQGVFGEEGSFIWVEKVTLSEEWEELEVEGLEGPKALGREEKDESPLQVEGRGEEETREAERRRVEGPEGAEKRGSEGKAGTEPEGAETSLALERKGSPDSMEPERCEVRVETEIGGGDEPLSAERREVEGPLGAERGRDEKPLGVEQKGGEEKLEAIRETLAAERKEGEESLVAERIGGEKPLEEKEKGDEKSQRVERIGDEEPSEAKTRDEKSQKVERTRGEEPSEIEKNEDGDSLKVERMGGEEPWQTEKTLGVEEEQRESAEEEECQAEDVREAGAPPEAKEAPRPEDEGQQPQKEEGSPEAEVEAVKPQAPAEGQDPTGDATALLAETSAQDQPAECQPLLQMEGPRANPRARPVPTYTPARQPEPSAPPEGEEASGPKQKTCQCCVVM